MPSFLIGTWSCSPPTSIVSLLALVLLAHLFLSPYFSSSVVYFGGSPTPNSSASINGSDSAGDVDPDLDAQLPAVNQSVVFYRGAPWKAEIGIWLSGCDSVSQKVEINEVIESKVCKGDCSGQGICNQELGECRCFHGFTGDDCSAKLQLECNLPASKEWPYGTWIVSICSVFCDKTRAMCFCGEGTIYPNRPLAEACGFVIEPPSVPGGPRLANWSRKDPDVLTRNSSKPGWCNVDPKEWYASKVQRKMACDCKYDCLWGDLCEVPTVCSCVNQCSGHGHCRGGFCQCSNGWYGADCSIPSLQSPMSQWPTWLRPAAAIIPESSVESSKLENIKAIVQKRRPLIYVYDLPPEFNSHLLEGRHFKYQCVNRIYSGQNRTIWTDQLYGAQVILLCMKVYWPVLTGQDYFYVPVLDSCLIARADDAPHLRMTEHMGSRSYFTLDLYKRAYDHILEKYPHWNRSSGRDHIWMFSWDEGACYAPKEIWDSMMLVHWGNTNTKHNHSTTAYWGDNWDRIPIERRGNHSCFDPRKDLVIPAWKRPDPYLLQKKLWARPRSERKTLFYFNGNLGPAYENGRPESTYSMGIRQKVAEEFGSTPNKEGKLGKQHAADVTVTPKRTSDYFNELSRSLFCGVFPGDGWSGRMEDSILQGCIPVVVQDGIFLPYENVLNYETFAVRISEKEIPNLIRLLRSINETTIETMLGNVKKIWQRFLYRDSIMLEAERQRHLFGDVEDWGVEFSKLQEDDVFATVIQALHYKLHNDDWRRQADAIKREFGLPKKCLMKEK